MSEQNMRIAVIICTVGRPDTVAELVPHLAAQTRSADRVVFAVTKPEDVGHAAEQAFDQSVQVDVVISEKGLTRQRNAGLAQVLDDCDLAVFFDDDYVPSRNALKGIAAAFGLWPEINGLTGHLLADGINGPGLDDASAARLVAEYDATHPEVAPTVLRTKMEGLYGCNMAYRLSAVGSLRFDEELPLYGWQEDVDFAARLPGQRIATDALVGVHRGAKGGRETSGVKLGYSQLVNPWFLWRKGSLSGKFALRLAVRNTIANHIKMMKSEPWIDRKARAAGNWRAIWDILTFKAHPKRILEF